MTMFLYQKCFYDHVLIPEMFLWTVCGLSMPSSWKSFFKQSNLQYYCKGTSDISIYNCEGRMPGFRAPDILGTWARMNEILLKEGGNAEIKK